MEELENKERKTGLDQHFNFAKLLQFTLPCIGMMVLTSVYSIVDGFFVSNFAGKNAFAAVNVVMPVLMALSTLGFMVGTGGSALIAFNLGEKNIEKANNIFSMLVKVLIVSGITLSAIGEILMPHIVIWLGATPAIIDDAVLYGRILIISLTFFMLQNSFQSFFVAADRANMGLIVSAVAGVGNMILDFLLVFVFRLGLLGAAIASASMQIVAGTIPLVYFLRPNKTVLRIGKSKMDWKALLKTCTNGSSELLSNICMSIVSMLYNAQLLKYAAEDGVAAYGVIMYVGFIFSAVFIGFAIGTGPLFGYQYGAQNFAELKNILKRSLIMISTAAVFMFFLSESAALPFAKLFTGYDEGLCDLTVRAFRIYSFSFLLCGFNIFTSSFFTGLGNGLVSALISFIRTMIFQTGSVFILPIFLGVNGIWVSVIVAEGLAMILSLSFLFAYRKTYTR